MTGSIYILDDDKTITDAYSIFLKRSGIKDYKIINDPREFVRLLDSVKPAAVFLDLQMPYHTGEEILDMLKVRYPSVPVIIITGNSDVDTAVRCIQKGALNFLVKPLDKDRFAAAYHSAMNAQQMQMEISALRSSKKAEETDGVCEFHGIITADARMKEVFRYIESVSKSSFPTLVTGETGVGKELFAGAVHKCSGRKGDFVPVNVAGLDDTMFTDTLFGHVKGAFTGADKPRQGLVAAAEGGTLFLDEIGDLTESAQVKLLRLLQEKVYSPLGSDKFVRAEVRIVAATNADLVDNVAKGRFRQDLFYRLTTHMIDIPPLRERSCDIAHLAPVFYSAALREVGLENEGIPVHVLRTLEAFSFPGNVRQLQAVVSDMAMVFGGRKPSERESDAFLRRHGITSIAVAVKRYSYDGPFPTLKDIEQHIVDAAVKETDGNVSSAARLLGITRQALHKRLKGS